MSRAMNLTMAEAKVREACEQAAVKISAIEVLPRGGTHLVCLTIEGADEMRSRLGTYLIAEKVKRFPFYRSRGT